VAAASASVALLTGVSAVRQRRTTQALVVEFLREGILSGALRGGARLVQDKVVWLSLEEIAEIFDIRELLVLDAVRRVVPTLTDKQVARLADIDRRQTTEENMATGVRLTHSFYTTLFESLDRPRQRALMDKLEREVERYLQPLERPHLGHARLIDACRKRDAERATAIMRDHLRKLRDRALECMRSLMSSGEGLRPKPTKRGA